MTAPMTFEEKIEELSPFHKGVFKDPYAAAAFTVGARKGRETTIAECLGLLRSQPQCDCCGDDTSLCCYFDQAAEWLEDKLK